MSTLYVSANPLEKEYPGKIYYGDNSTKNNAWELFTEKTCGEKKKKTCSLEDFPCHQIVYIRTVTTSSFASNTRYKRYRNIYQIKPGTSIPTRPIPHYNFFVVWTLPFLAVNHIRRARERSYISSPIKTGLIEDGVKKKRREKEREREKGEGKITRGKLTLES